jgi:hypothetical protein
MNRFGTVVYRIISPNTTPSRSGMSVTGLLQGSHQLQPRPAVGDVRTPPPRPPLTSGALGPQADGGTWAGLGEHRRLPPTTWTIPTCCRCSELLRVLSLSAAGLAATRNGLDVESLYPAVYEDQGMIPVTARKKNLAYPARFSTAGRPCEVRD